MIFRYILIVCVAIWAILLLQLRKSQVAVFLHSSQQKVFPIIIEDCIELIFHFDGDDSSSISFNSNPTALEHLQLIVESIVKMRTMGFTLQFVNEIHNIERTKIAIHCSEKSCKQIL